MRTTLSLTQIVDQWLAEADALPSTKDDYRRKIGLWFRWLSSRKVDPREPQRIDIIDYKRYLMGIGKSAFTYNGYITVVKLFYSFCDEHHYYDNIGLGIKSSFKMKQYYKRPLSAEQSSALLSSIDSSTTIGKRDKLIIFLMLTNGLRTCEVQRINVEDFDKINDAPVLHIQRKGHTDKHDIVVLADEAVDLLEDYLSGREFTDGDPLFISHMKGRENSRINKGTIGTIIKRRLRAIGINEKDITAHSLRHTCASLMIEQGLDPQLVQDMLGHSNASTTKLYTMMARNERLFEHRPSRLLSSIVMNKPKK
ncbi:MAG: tyrosine-type recombinase/integrase [Bacteroidales bacterium]|jgi:site-specific recombinase XerD|nr:tyrosine-type recombinase/integrase [Bacteroidales bacterium]